MLQEISIKNLNHLGIIAGIIDELSIVNIVNKELVIEEQEIVNSGEIIKAIILNGLGFVSQPLYLFPQFFQDKATSHLLGQGIFPKHLNEHKIGRVMDKLYEKGWSELFLLIALSAVKKYQINFDFSHLDSTSFSVEGKYNQSIFSESESQRKEKEREPIPIKITYGYSKDNRPDLKQFILNLKLIQAQLKFHIINEIKITNNQDKTYQITGIIQANHDVIEAYQNRAGKFMIATNRLDRKSFTCDEMLIKYKEQQNAERGFAFLKDPLFFADSIFLKSPRRIEAMAMLMGLCLMVYSLGQREVRRQLSSAKTGIPNQLGKLTDRPTLRWIFQCFQGIHILVHQGIKQVVNLTEERQLTLKFFPLSWSKYYILSG